MKSLQKFKRNGKLKSHIFIYSKIYVPFNREHNVRVLKLLKYPDRPSRFVLS